VLAGLFVYFALNVRGGLTPENWSNLFDRTRHWAIPGMLAVPMTFIIAAAGIDLSVASILALSGMVLGLTWEKGGVHIYLAALVGIVAATLAGAINGLLSGKAKLAPLVVTLATMAAYRGLAMGITESKPISQIPETFHVLGQGTLAGLPIQLYLWAFIVIAGLLMLHKMWIGPAVLAIGENPRAARYAALPVEAIVLGLYTFSGLVAGLAAAVYVAQYTGANPNMETGLELKVIACVIIGGTRITGGNASLIGTTLGVALVGMLEYDLDLAEFPRKYHPVVIGFLVILAGTLNETLSARAARRQLFHPASN
jgi:ribose/xylose/arabinose/galactoside ABC-type transport system permease subunit